MRPVDANVASAGRVDSKAQAEQVRAVSVERLAPVLGRLPASVMDQVDEALRLHLHL